MTIKPALTPEEWAEWRKRGPNYARTLFAHWATESLAAVLLHGQPFGFTWDDVDRIREGVLVLLRYTGHVIDASAIDEITTDTLLAEPGCRFEAGLWELADKVAALLPPREGA